ncbi:MAG: hypothetical protein CM15mP47_1000 [Methanobacteriota archaeon]|nr:MAG: hypothetical protein CM15mP47_1000 [Euryarchaeota archaeon]
MSSVFTTPPPSFSNDEALILLKDNFDISGTLERLPSDRDQVFHARGDGNNYILKIYNSEERACVIELQDAAATHIMKNDKSLLVPKSLQNLSVSKKNFISIRLMPYYTGSFLNEKICKHRLFYFG